MCLFIYIFDPWLPKININCCFCWAFLFTAFCNAKHHGGKKCVCTHLRLSSSPIRRWRIYLCLCVYIHTHIHTYWYWKQSAISLSHYCIQFWQSIFFPTSFSYSCFTVCEFLFYSRMNQPCIYTQPLPFEFLSYSGCDRALSRVPCAIYRRLSLVIYFIRRINSVYMCIPISHFLPFPFPPWYPYKRGSENEVNQEGKNKYQLLSHICGI